jgi:hypothetical protein
MALFKLPRGLCQHITSLIRKFWWGSKKGERKAAWVSWESMAMPKYRGGLGFRDIEIFNLALLARQVWRIIEDPNSLSARVLKAVYFPDSDVLNAAVGSNPSQVWRSLCEGRDILKQGMIKRIGDGTTTHIWNDNWLPRDFSLCPIAQDPPTMVAELFCPVTRTWNIETLQKFFLPMDVDVIKQIPLSHTLQRDCWAWNYEKTGIFTVRSAYRMVVEMKHRRENWLEGRSEASGVEEKQEQWKKLWKTKVPSKLRIFAWRLARSSLPTGQERMRRHMATSDVCPICNAASDSWRHSLLDCNMARAVWSLSDEDVFEHLLADGSEDPKLWLLSLCENLCQSKFILVLTTLWSIWWARRRAIHEDEFQSPLSTHHFIERYVEDLGLINKVSAASLAPSRPTAKWQPPQAGFMKIHSDGAVAKTHMRGAVGVICRDENGTFQGASAVVFDGITDPPTLEAYACREALDLAEDLHIQKLTVISDCLTVVNEINSSKQMGR